MMRIFAFLGVAALALSALIGCEGTKPAPKTLSAADQKALGDKLKAAEERAVTFRKQRMEALQNAHGSRLPTSGPCPVKVPLPPEMRDASKPSRYNDDPGSEAQRWRMNIINALALRNETPPKELKMVQEIEWKVAVKGPRAWQFERQRDMLQKMADGSDLGSFNRDEALALADKLGSDDYWGWELNIVADAYNRPSYSDDKSFKSGTVLGRAYLYSFPNGRILCSGDVVAQNRKSITLEIEPKVKGEQRHQMLEDDLKNSAFRVAVQQLRAVKEQPAPAASGSAAVMACFLVPPM